MALRILDRLAKWAALRGYRARLGPLLVERYGRQRYYTPPQVLTTIKRHGFNERFAPYACAMFCSKQAYSEFAVGHDSKARSPVDPVVASSAAMWAGALSQEWPEHHDVVSDLGGGHWDHDSGFGSDHVGADSTDIGYGHDAGAGGHDGGSHGGGDGSY